MRRVIICGLFKYPRGGALANYIQYLASALQTAGYQVEILSYINPEFCSSDLYEYKNVSIHEISCKKGPKPLRRLMNGKLFPITLENGLKKLKLSENDVVIPSFSVLPLKSLFKLKNKYGFKTVGIPLEWFSDEDFSNDYYRREFRERFAMNQNHDLLFPISHLISEQFPNVPSLILPPMTDTHEFPFVEKKEGPYEFIFSANGKMKDALPEMLQGTAMLSDEQIGSMKLHLTGVKEETVREILDETDFERLKDTLIVHNWMQYDELIALYQRVHYLFLARKTCQMTLANFPSKVPEAMTYGIVPVVSRVGDYTKYYLEDNVNSLIFDGYDKKACYESLCRALEVPFSDYQKLSHGARKCAEDRFDYRNWSEPIKDKIESLYKKD